jgi:hypothetical protein
MSKRLPKNEYERGWNDAFDALVSLGLLTDLFWPLPVVKRDKIYRCLIREAKEAGVEIYGGESTNAKSV